MGQNHLILLNTKNYGHGISRYEFAQANDCRVEGYNDFFDHAQNAYNSLTLFGSYSTKKVLKALVYTG